MSRLRDDPVDFEGAISQASDRLGLAPLFVEKDYWITQALRALHEHHPGAFVLKGGTSLSKGYGLIERFSEDVDILVLPAKGGSAATRERLLQTMIRSESCFGSKVTGMTANAGPSFPRCSSRLPSYQRIFIADELLELRATPNDAVVGVEFGLGCVRRKQDSRDQPNALPVFHRRGGILGHQKCSDPATRVRRENRVPSEPGGHSGRIRRFLLVR